MVQTPPARTSWTERSSSLALTAVNLSLWSALAPPPAVTAAAAAALRATSGVPDRKGGGGLWPKAQIYTWQELFFAPPGR
jgi:hypothetical protein